jgi:hypothetical protein
VAAPGGAIARYCVRPSKRHLLDRKNLRHGNDCCAHRSSVSIGATVYGTQMIRPRRAHGFGNRRRQQNDGGGGGDKRADSGARRASGSFAE